MAWFLLRRFEIEQILKSLERRNSEQTPFKNGFFQLFLLLWVVFL